MKIVIESVCNTQFYNYLDNTNHRINEIWKIKRYYKLNSKIINNIIKAKTFEEIKEIMSKTVYKKVFINENELEEDIDRYLYEVNKKIFQNDITSIAYIFAYVNMIDYENNDIINTIEGIRYNMDKQEILKRLVQ